MERTKNATNKIYKHRRVSVDVASLNLMAGKVEGRLKAHALVDHHLTKVVPNCSRKCLA